METRTRRLYVGGLSPLVTKTELADRFGKFGKVDDVDIICRKDEQGNPIKTFAYLNIDISDVDLKKCTSVLNKTKWKGGILQIETAKESFLHKLSQERQQVKEEKKTTTWCSQNDLAPSAVPGTEVPNHKDWVVGKFGRVLPVLHLGKNHSKVMKYDPSRYCHNLKKIKDPFEQVSVSQLTWQVEGGDDEISRKRRGEFPDLSPSMKRKKLQNLPKIGGNDTRRDHKTSLGSMQTIKCQSDTKVPLHNKTPGSLQKKVGDGMTDESHSEDEPETVAKQDLTNANFADFDIEVVSDSWNLDCITSWGKSKASPKIYSTCNTMDDSDSDSANTDEIITVSKTAQKRLKDFKTKTEIVKRDDTKILDFEGSSYARGTKGKSNNAEISKLGSESESRSSEDDGSNFHSESDSGSSEDDSSNSDSEEYKAMMQNCCRLDLTLKDLETLAKEANECEKEETAYDGEHDTDDSNASEGYVAESPKGIKTKVSKKDPVPNVKQKKGLEPKDIVASILEDESDDQKSTNRKKEDAPLKPPAFKGLGSMLASTSKVNSLSSPFTTSNVKMSAVSKIKNDQSLSSCRSKQTKSEEKQTFKDSKHTILKAESNNGSSSSDEDNSDLVLAAKTKAKHNNPRADAAKEQTVTKEKQQQDNQKRLVAVMERRKELELQKQIIQGALLHLDSQGSKKSKHVVFSSESESEKEDESSTSKKSMHADNQTKPNTSKLFSSSEDDSDDDEKVDERFEIKAQYEGMSGKKLMELQSRFGKDERFKMDSRFLESSSEDDEASNANKSHADKEYEPLADEENNLSAEKKKNLDILQSILKSQPATKQTNRGKTIKDLNSLHYDPTKPEHAALATQAEEKKESKVEKKKKRLEKENLPDVSKEIFHEINVDLKEVFGSLNAENRKVPDVTWDQEVAPEKEANQSNETFSFQNKEEPMEFTFSFFGNATESRTSNDEPYKVEPIKPAKVAWREDSRFQDSSEGEDDEVDAAGATENKSSHSAPLRVSTGPDVSTLRFFFFVKGDERLKTGPSMFFRSSTAKKDEEDWEQRKDLLLEECRKRHKDAKRKNKTRN